VGGEEKMKKEKKNKIPMLILIGIVILLILGSLNKVFSNVTNISGVPIYTSSFFDKKTIENSSLYVYCTEQNKHLPDESNGVEYTYCDTTSIDTKNMTTEDIKNNENNEKIIKEAYIMNNGNKVNSDYSTYFEGYVKELGNKGLATYMLKLLCSPNQIAIWELEGGNGIGIGSYTVDWNMSGYYSSFRFCNDERVGYVYRHKDTDPTGATDTTTEARAKDLEGAFNSTTGTINDWIVKNNNEVTDLITKATNFYDQTINGKTGIARVTDGLSTPTVDYNQNDYVYVGPYEITFNKLNTITVLDNEEQDVSSKISFATYNQGSKSYQGIDNIESGKEFYLKINKDSMPDGIKTIKFSGMNSYYKFTYYKLSTSKDLALSKQQLIACGNYTEYDEQCECDIPANITLIPKLNVTIDKKDQKLADLNSRGAKFNIKFEQDGKELTATNNTVQPTATSDVKVTITETTAPNGYALLESPIELTFTYNQKDAKWEGTITTAPALEKSGIEISNAETAKGKTTVTLKVTDLAKIDTINLLKVSSLDSKTAVNAKFNITLTNVISVKNGNTAQSAKNDEMEIIASTTGGKLLFTDLVVKDLNKPVIITLEETETEKGYRLDTTPVRIEINYKAPGEWTVTTGTSTTTDTSTKLLGDVNEDGKVTSADALAILNGATDLIGDVDGDGKVTGADNVSDAYLLLRYVAGDIDSRYKIGQLMSDGKTLLGDVNGDGKVNSADALAILKGSVVPAADVNADGKVKIANDGTDAYYILQYTAGNKELPYKIGEAVNSSTNTDNTNTNANNSENSSASTSGNTVTVTIKNTPMMNLGGKVWLDQFNGDYKTGATRNGTFNDGEQLAGINVYLYNGDTLVTKDVDGNDITNPTTTNSEGRYEFNRINVANYTLKFEYEGIKYTTVADKTNNDATEVDRDVFNSKFETITTTGSSKEETQGTTNAEKTLKYTNEDNKATLATTEQAFDNLKDGQGKYNTASIFATYSYDFTKNKNDWQGTWETGDSLTGKGTPNYKSNFLNIDCGLQERIFDLSLGTDITNATVAINGKDTTYTYDQILNGDLQNDITRYKYAENNTNGQVSYNLHLYDSDYKFRLENYNGGINKIKTGDTIEGNGTVESNNLSVSLTYKIVITNQSLLDDLTKGEVKVNGIKDYYDSSYKLTGITYNGIQGNGTIADKGKIDVDSVVSNNKTTTIDGKSYNQIDLSSGFTKIDLGNSTNPDQLNRIEIYLTFELNPETNEYKNLENNPIDAGNIAEITSYYTQQGMIDIDSAPDNCIINDNLRYEDDTDSAGTLKISIPQTNVRKISGKVFDDGKFTVDNTANGKLDNGENGENGVNDVIVQLIELISVNMTTDGINYAPHTCEYIWQETRSGSKQNQRIKFDNSGIIEESNQLETNEDGQYQFTGFIPGNYIIRFIYGDGSTYNIYGNENVKRYNGQDYKSTVDKNYKYEWYNNATYTPGDNTARDVEARRLEVMSYSTTIDNTKGKAISNKDNNMLDATWMCADTSKINVDVDTNDKTSTKSTSEVKGTDVPANTFENIDFGLSLRPQTKLVLEKHITGLKVTTDAGTLTDAKADIKDILNNNAINSKGETKGLSTIVSERGNRGFWKLETDLDELGQGANLEVTYTYVVKNMGDTDYLSNKLLVTDKAQDKIGKDIDGDGKDDYVTYLKDKALEMKASMSDGTYNSTINPTIGRYLGTFYYTGDKGSDEEVPTRADEIQEAINNALTLDTAKTTLFEKVTVADDSGSAYAKAKDPTNLIDPNAIVGANNRIVWRDDTTNRY
jgi:hypothetical protein